MASNFFRDEVGGDDGSGADLASGAATEVSC